LLQERQVIAGNLMPRTIHAVGGRVLHPFAPEDMETIFVHHLHNPLDPEIEDMCEDLSACRSRMHQLEEENEKLRTQILMFTAVNEKILSHLETLSASFVFQDVVSTANMVTPDATVLIAPPSTMIESVSAEPDELPAHTAGFSTSPLGYCAGSSSG
ncbi:hypothetical protein PHLCEN_2v185, partial [Hermanssonia centrifuga]